MRRISCLQTHNSDPKRLVCHITFCLSRAVHGSVPFKNTVFRYGYLRGVSGERFLAKGKCFRKKRVFWAKKITRDKENTEAWSVRINSTPGPYIVCVSILPFSCIMFIYFYYVSVLSLINSFVFNCSLFSLFYPYYQAILFVFLMKISSYMCLLFTVKTLMTSWWRNVLCLM